MQGYVLCFWLVVRAAVFSDKERLVVNLVTLPFLPQVLEWSTGDGKFFFPYDLYCVMQ